MADRLSLYVRTQVGGRSIFRDRLDQSPEILSPGTKLMLWAAVRGLSEETMLLAMGCTAFEYSKLAAGAIPVDMTIAKLLEGITSIPAALWLVQESLFRKSGNPDVYPTRDQLTALQERISAINAWRSRGSLWR